MSEQEQKSGGGAGGSSIVLVEQSAASRHKQPFRPTELQDESSDLHHKRSRAPAVPSAVAEELKDNANSDTKDRIECERAMSSEKQKHSMAKKLSSTAKRRGSSPEAITLAQLEVDTKKGSVTPPPQPIPALQGSDDSGAITEKSAERKEEDDSITDEIADLRTPDVAKKASDWEDKTHDNKRKEVSWHDDEYLDKVKNLGACSRSHACVLECKSSIGPCFRSTAPFGRPSGIAICLPNKRAKPSGGEDCSQPKSVINIIVSKKSVVTNAKSHTENVIKNTDEQVPRVKILGTLKEKLSNMTGKIKNVLTF